MLDTKALPKSAYNSLTTLLILRLIKEKFASDPHAVKTAAGKLIPVANKDALTSIVAPVNMSNNPIYLLEKKADTFTTLNQAREKFVEEDFHAMIVHDGQMIPVRLDLEDQEDLDWAVKHQNDLYGLIGEAYARSEKITTLEAQIILFPEWGFEGKMKQLKSSFSNSAGETSMRKLFMKGEVHKRVSKTRRKK